MKFQIKAIKNQLVEFLKEKSEKIGIKNAVIGLSGGVDSAVSAYLSAEAFGPENVLCVLMPFETSSKESISDAKRVVSNLKVRYDVIEISKIVKTFLKLLGNDAGRIRKGNIMARVRMIILYDYSSKENALVIGTGNKTEILLGYTTVYGDSACGINPLGNLYKTQIWLLAKYLGVPDSIINKKPSADLWKGQTDEDELGFTYREVDKYLNLKYDLNYPVKEIIKKGFDKRFILRVDNIVEKNKFKSSLPAIPKLIY
jgi:NAD+ synthase